MPRRLTPDQIQRLARETLPEAMPTIFTDAQRTQMRTRIAALEDPVVLAALDAGLATPFQVQQGMALLFRVVARVDRALLRES